MRAVELNGVLITLRVEPVEEDACAHAHAGRAAGERGPHPSSSRSDVPAANDRLMFLPDANAERQVLAHANVVLRVDAGLTDLDRDTRIADVSRERGRMIAAKRFEAPQREPGGGVTRHVAGDAGVLDQDPHAHRMIATRDVHVVANLDVPRIAAAGNLCAAA